ncbi:MAG: hypothetical protein MUP49_05795 [Dehalococcoidia bacterium]|nr:hypothetical protein [Dehalococcoidia bacterium]
MEREETTEKPVQSHVTFLLKEYEEQWAQARHVDEYMERVPRFFLIVVGATVAAVTTLIRFAELTSFSFIAGGIGLILLALIGLMASLTIPRYRVIRNSYFNATYLIRKYFVDRAQELRNYMWWPIGGTFEGYSSIVRVDFFRFMMMVIMDSGLMLAGLYAVQNSQALANSDPSVWWLVWALPFEMITFVGLHFCLYFLIIKHYEAKDREKSERLERKGPIPQS